MYDLIVIGAGAAGLMAAATAAANEKKVLLLEKMERAGRKIRISGKGRCNVTNARPADEFKDSIRTNADFFEIAFAEFNNKATMRFFERLGVRLDVERGDRVFPKSGKAWDISNALVEQCEELGVEICYHTEVKEIITISGKVYGVNYQNRKGFERKAEAENILVATGGVSYPATGSTGDGYMFASETGHNIEPVRPSLTALVSSHPQVAHLQDVWLKNVRVKLLVDDQLRGEEFGEVSFSDRGIEGPTALRLSRDAVDALIDGHKVSLTLDLKPALDEQTLVDRIHREIADLKPDDFFAELMRKLVPKPLIIPLCMDMDIHSRGYVSKLTDEDINKVIRTLKCWTFEIVDYAPFECAIVTAGGVDCSQVNKYTMESLLVKGLYFAGEVLDIDANTGGYNLQIAFSTGRLAGMLKK